MALRRIDPDECQISLTANALRQLDVLLPK